MDIIITHGDQPYLCASSHSSVDKLFVRNVTALKKSQPKSIENSLINFIFALITKPLVTMYEYGSTERYVNFYTDFAFKKFFGTEANKDLLISFLNSLLDLKEGKNLIVDLKHQGTEKLGDNDSDRRAVFDVYCTNEKGEHFIVEMQRSDQKFFKDRSLYYSTFPIREEAVKGKTVDKDNPDRKVEWNYELHTVYVIGVLNFIFDVPEDKGIKTKDRVVTRVYLKDDDNDIFNEHLQFVYVEMPKFRKRADELHTMLDKWLYAIKNLNKLDERPGNLKEKIFKKLFEIAEIAKYDKKEFGEYQKSLKILRDYYNSLSTAVEKAKKEGIEQGRAEGMEKGMEKGRAEGILSVAKNLKASGMDINTIANLTGLSTEEINKI